MSGVTSWPGDHQLGSCLVCVALLAISDETFSIGDHFTWIGYRRLLVVAIPLLQLVLACWAVNVAFGSTVSVRLHCGKPAQHTNLMNKIAFHTHNKQSILGGRKCDSWRASQPFYQSSQTQFCYSFAVIFLTKERIVLTLRWPEGETAFARERAVVMSFRHCRRTALGTTGSGSGRAIVADYLRPISN